MHAQYTGTGFVNDMVTIQRGNGAEVSHPINSLKYEHGRGHTVAIEKRINLHLHIVMQRYPKYLYLHLI